MNRITAQDFPRTAAAISSARNLVRLSPVSMPAQNLSARPRAFRNFTPAATRRSTESTTILSLICGATTIATAVFAHELARALSLQNGGTIGHYLFLLNASLLFAWIAFAAANSTAGAIAIILGRGRDTIRLPAAGTPIATRTALLFPVYHENPDDIAERIVELDSELRNLALHEHFDVFILSDSQNEEARHAEHAAFAPLMHAPHLSLRVHYRNREKNTAKKAGNIGDWVTRHGGKYSHFVIFDADSRMSGALLARLAAAMEHNHDSGIIQTVPRLVNPKTLFASLTAFAHNIYGPAFAAGFATWQGASGNYWGHNAIIRTKAFAESAGLPELPGKAPFGGHIQSHDFVEAALIRRAGWRIDLVTSTPESSEEGPPTIVDMAVRDRRWMQGNLQHLAVLGTSGMVPISRLHIALGILGYLSSALWALMLIVGTWLSWHEQYRITDYFPDTETLFPAWPTFDPEAGLAVLQGTALVLFLPKISGLTAHLLTKATGIRESLRTVGIAIAETLISMLIAPVMMVIHVRGTVEILLGRDSGWAAQQRETGGIALYQALRFHGIHIALGLMLAAISVSISLQNAMWMSPVTAGLVLSPVVTWITSMRLKAAASS